LAFYLRIRRFDWSQFCRSACDASGRAVRKATPYIAANAVRKRSRRLQS
jgi:hypothetical protein